MVIVIDCKAYAISSELYYNVVSASADCESSDYDKAMIGRNNLDMYIKYIVSSVPCVSADEMVFKTSERANRDFERVI